MMSRTRRCPSREGTVTVVVAVSMIAILSIVALSLDGGMMLDKRRQIQTASDAAALAGTDDLYARWYTNTTSGLDNTSGTAQTAAQKATKANGFENGVNGCVVTVNIPPLSGPFTGKTGHIEVIISYPQKRFFSRIFGTEDVPIGARAVARGLRTSIKQAILVLDPTGSSAFNAGGNGNVYVTGSPIHVNSTSSSAMIANGGGSSGAVVANEFDVGGIPGWTTTGGGSFTGPIVSNSPPIPDPLVNLPAPDPSTMITQRTNKLVKAGNSNITLNPGVYIGGIAATGGNITLNPGIYYMQGGGFSVGGQASVSGTGVMIYNAPLSTSDKISIAGSGVVNLTAPTTGPYQGILLFQDRTSTVQMEVSGSGGSSMSGLFYAAAANLKVTGNGGADVLGSQYISYNLTLSGNGGYGVNWSPNTTPGKRALYLVE